jgi:hypothetical protein
VPAALERAPFVRHVGRPHHHGQERPRTGPTSAPARTGRSGHSVVMHEGPCSTDAGELGLFEDPIRWTDNRVGADQDLTPCRSPRQCDAPSPPSRHHLLMTRAPHRCGTTVVPHQYYAGAGVVTPRRGRRLPRASPALGAWALWHDATAPRHGRHCSHPGANTTPSLGRRCGRRMGMTVTPHWCGVLSVADRARSRPTPWPQDASTGALPSHPRTPATARHDNSHDLKGRPGGRLTISKQISKPTGTSPCWCGPSVVPHQNHTSVGMVPRHHPQPAPARSHHRHEPQEVAPAHRDPPMPPPLQGSRRNHLPATGE